MAQHVSELCTLLVDDLFGELSAKVFSTLARLGRLTLRDLVRHTGLRPRSLKHGIAVLVQQHLALHCTSDDDAITYYEVNWPATYGLLRLGKLIELVDERFGVKAADVVNNLLLFGHVRVKELADAYNLSEEPVKNVVTSNRTATNRVESLGQLHSILKDLFDAGLVIGVHKTHFRSAADNHINAERKVREAWFQNGIKGKEQREEFTTHVRNLKRSWRDGDGDILKPRASQVSAAERPSKRIKVNGQPPNGADEGAVGGGPSPLKLLNDDGVIRVNFDKFNVLLRNQLLVKLARLNIGSVTSKVYEALLRVLEKKISRCYDELDVTVEDEDTRLENSPAATTLDIVSALDQGINLARGVRSFSGDRPTAELRNGATVNGDATRLGVPTERIHEVQRHMRLLCQSSKKFAYRTGTRGFERWQVDFRSLSHVLIQSELEILISARFNSLTTRVVRILHDKGKLDEKQVGTIAMSKIKDVRTVLNDLQQAGYVDIQEVPKDNTRQPSRTMFLWFFDQARCRQLVLHDAYKAMCRLFQQIKVQRARNQLVLDKAERAGAVGKERQYLSSHEQAALDHWKDIEEKLLTQLGRQDELVAVLRDFTGPASG